MKIVGQILEEFEHYGWKISSPRTLGVGNFWQSQGNSGAPGWISYFTKLQAPSNEITLEFLQHLQNGQSIVKRVRIIVSEVVIAQVSRLSVEGATWLKEHVMLHDVVEIFKDAVEELTWKGKGIQLIPSRRTTVVIGECHPIVHYLWWSMGCGKTMET